MLAIEIQMGATNSYRNKNQVLYFMLAIVIQVAALVYIQGLPFMFTSTCTTLWSHTNDGCRWFGVRPLVC